LAIASVYWINVSGGNKYCALNVNVILAAKVKCDPVTRMDRKGRDILVNEPHEPLVEIII
jgi:hypothetical protein